MADIKNDSLGSVTATPVASRIPLRDAGRVESPSDASNCGLLDEPPYPTALCNAAINCTCFKSRCFFILAFLPPRGVDVPFRRRPLPCG